MQDYLRDVYLCRCFERVVVIGHLAVLLQRLFKQAISRQQQATNSIPNAKQQLFFCHVTITIVAPLQWRYNDNLLIRLFNHPMSV